MDRLRATIGLCVLCVVGCSALAVQGAGAVTFGTTGFTCAKGAQPGGETTKGFSDEHCTAAAANDATHLENVKFEHVAVPESTTTEGLVTNQNTNAGTTGPTPFFLKATIATIPIKLEATGVSTTEGAWGENRKEGSEHYAFGEGKTRYTGVKVVEPANCKVVQGANTGEIETTQIVGTTKGQGMAGKLQPKAGEATAFAEFEIVQNGANPCAAAQKVKIVGSIQGTPNGATIEYTHEGTTAQKTLRFGSAAGPIIGLEGKTTGVGGAKGSGLFFPGAATTVETP